MYLTFTCHILNKLASFLILESYHTGNPAHCFACALTVGTKSRIHLSGELVGAPTTAWGWKQQLMMFDHVQEHMHTAPYLACST